MCASTTTAVIKWSSAACGSLSELTTAQVAVTTLIPALSHYWLPILSQEGDPKLHFPIPGDGNFERVYGSCPEGRAGTEGI